MNVKTRSKPLVRPAMIIIHFKSLIVEDSQFPQVTGNQ